MAAKIKLSEIKALGCSVEQFRERVSRLVLEVQAWADHMLLVAQGVAKEYPPPIESPLVVGALSLSVVDGKNVYAADFELVDDGPTDKEILTQKKHELARGILDLEKTMIDLLHPPLRRRKQARLLAAANSKRSPEEDAYASSVDALGHSAGADAKNVAAMIKAKKPRSPSDEAVLAAHDELKAKLDAIDAWAADKMEEIDGLTEQDVDGWAPGETPFPVG